MLTSESMELRYKWKAGKINGGAAPTRDIRKLQTSATGGYRPQRLDPAVSYPHIPIEEIAGRITVTRNKPEFIIEP